MKRVLVMFLAAAVVWPVLLRGQAPASVVDRGRGAGAPAVPSAPARGSLSVRETDTFQLRTGVSAILGWSVGIPLAAFPRLTFAEAAVKADALSVSSIEASGGQKVSAAIPHNLDPKLFPNEVRAV